MNGGRRKSSPILILNKMWLWILKIFSLFHKPKQLIVAKNNQTLDTVIPDFKNSLQAAYVKLGYDSQSIEKIAAQIIQDLPKKLVDSSYSNTYIWFSAGDYKATPESFKQVCNILQKNSSLQAFNLKFMLDSSNTISIAKEQVIRLACKLDQEKYQPEKEIDFTKHLHQKGIYR